MIRFFQTLIVLAGLSVAQAAADPMLVTPLSITSESATHEFTVEVADDPEETSMGLMFRESMDADKGMLFDFGNPRVPNMYM